MNQKKVFGLIGAAIAALLLTWLISGGYVTEDHASQVGNVVKDVLNDPPSSPVE